MENLPSEGQEYLNDPFEYDGIKKIFQNQFQFNIFISEKSQNIQKLPNAEILILKLGIMQDYSGPKKLKIQLTSDKDLYFNFIFVCNDWQFKRIKQTQQFYIEFRQYPSVILKNLQKLKLEPTKYSINFTIYSQLDGQMKIIRHSQFRDDTIIVCQFIKSNEQKIKQNIQYRFQRIKREYQMYQDCFDNITEVIKSKNPSLMMQIQKSFRKK